MSARMTDLADILNLAIPEWTRDALCARTDPHVFHPEKGELGVIAAARDICSRCPVAQPCFVYAINTNQPDGVWAGTTPRQRGQIRRRRRERKGAS